MRYSRRDHARQARDPNRSYCDVHHVWFDAVTIINGERKYLRCHRCVEDDQKHAAAKAREATDGQG